MRCRVSLCLALLTLSTFHLAQATESQLRWKFKQGDSFQYRTQQDTQSRTQVGPREVKSSTQQVIEQTWHIKLVADDGTADIGLTFDRLRIKYDTPSGLLQIDSAADNAGPDELAEIAGTLRTLTGAELLVRITPLGEIAEVVLPQAIREHLESARASQELQTTISEDGLKSMIAQSTVVVPERKLQPGDTWESQRGQLGAKMVLNYQYAGLEPMSNPATSTINISGKITLDDQPVPELRIRLAGQEVKGVIHFDAEAGRLQDLEMTQKTAIDITSGDTTGRQEVQVVLHTRLVEPTHDERETEPAPSEVKH